MKVRNVVMFSLVLISVVAATFIGMKIWHATAQPGGEQYTFTYGLVACWHFDEGSGNITHDSSGNGNDGTIYGATWIDGISGKALYFDGTDDWVKVENSPTLNIHGHTNITICTWIKPENVNKYHQSIIQKWGPGGAEDDQYTLELINKKIRFGLSDEITRIWSNIVLESDKWYFIVGVYNATENKIKLFINGRIDNEKNLTFSIWNTSRYIEIGRGSDYSYQAFKGIIDEISIYNRALSAEEIRQHYEEFSIPDIVYVDDDFNASIPGWQYDHFDKIQDGINAVAEGGTVYVFNGTYYENVIVNKTINLIGESREGTIIDAQGYMSPLRLTADRVNVSHFALIHSGESGNQFAGIDIDSDYNHIFDCNIYNNSEKGILAWHTYYNTIENCYIYNNDEQGIGLGWDCHFAVIKNCSVYNNGHEEIKAAYPSSHISIINCTVKGNIMIEDTSYCTIRDCEITDAPIATAKGGISVCYYIGSGHDNLIERNIIRDSHLYGIWIERNRNNIIRNNLIENSSETGIFIDSYSNGNLIYGNSFINNTIQAYDEGNNIWDNGYPSGGNYWSDFDEPSEGAYDNNSDGIVDSPYYIPGGNNVDRYPLMHPLIAIPPVANFSYSPLDPTDLDTIQFNDLSSDPDGYIVNWTWDFGDGSISYEQNPQHQYSMPGNYNVTLTVMDDDGAIDNITKRIVVVAGDINPPTTLCILSGVTGSHGWYRSNVMVTLNTTDDVTGVNATYYKIDNEVWQRYNNPFTISTNGVHILSFYSVDNYGNIEKIKTKRIKIDKTTPWTEIMVRGNITNGRYVDHVIIAFVGHDSYSGIDKIMYRIDGRKWNEYHAAIHIWREGKHVIEYYAIDKAGNEEAINSFNFKIDRYAPSVKVIYPNGGEIINGSIDIKWTAEDASNVSISIYYSNDNGMTWDLIAANEENDGIYEWNTRNVEDGMEYLIKVVAEDEAGHSSTDESDGTFTIYNNFIELNMMKPRQGYLYISDREILPLFGNVTVVIGRITVIADVSCGLPVEKVEFYVGEELKHILYEKPYSWTWDEFAVGQHEIRVIAHDIIGNSVEEKRNLWIVNI